MHWGTMVQQSAGGLLIGSAAYFLSRRRQLAVLAARYALPTFDGRKAFINRLMRDVALCQNRPRLPSRSRCPFRKCDPS
jgi:hypothetical protein